MDNPETRTTRMDNPETLTTRMDNPETLTTLGAPDTGQRLQKTKGVLHCPFLITSLVFLTFIWPVFCIPGVTSVSGLSIIVVSVSGLTNKG
jgi:hypothetical protein